MRAVRQFGIILLLLVACAAPVMACVMPDVQMTAAERACCLAMRNQCGQMEMPVSQDCCAKAPDTLLENALQPDPVRFQQVVSMALWVAPFDLSTRNSASQASMKSSEHSPPKSPPKAITILRI